MIILIETLKMIEEGGRGDRGLTLKRINDIP